jgi:hypothetical protein
MKMYVRCMGSGWLIRFAYVENLKLCDVVVSVGCVGSTLKNTTWGMTRLSCEQCRYFTRMVQTRGKQAFRHLGTMKREKCRGRVGDYK